MLYKVRIAVFDDGKFIKDEQDMINRRPLVEIDEYRRGQYFEYVSRSDSEEVINVEAYRLIETEFNRQNLPFEIISIEEIVRKE